MQKEYFHSTHFARSFYERLVKRGVPAMMLPVDDATVYQWVVVFYVGA